MTNPFKRTVEVVKLLGGLAHLAKEVVEMKRRIRTLERHLGITYHNGKKQRPHYRKSK